MNDRKQIHNVINKILRLFENCDQTLEVNCNIKNKNNRLCPHVFFYKTVKVNIQAILKGKKTILTKFSFQKNKNCR